MTQTPFRYPGAKNRMLPIIMEHIDPLIKFSFIDVFVGGGSVLLEVAQKYPNITLYANDKDYWMYCFWNVVASDDSSKLEALLELVARPPTLELFYKLRAEATTDEIQCAYRAIFFNRTTFSGILNSGPIGGKEQNSQYKIDCRYNANKIKQKIIKCNNLLAGRTIVTNNDFSKLDVFTKTDTPAYCDPPYYIMGDTLYREKMIPQQHFILRNILDSRKNWILSYDDCPSIRAHYQNKNIIDLSARYSINGKKKDWANKNELIILP